jgi:hypothetical protein
VENIRRKRDDNMRRPSSASERVRVPEMSESMRETMAREQAEALATLMKANRAFERIFGTEEEEDNE